MDAATLLGFFCLIIAAFSTGADAGYWSWGDTTCLLVGLFLGFIVICIILGFVARKVNGTAA